MGSLASRPKAPSAPQVVYIPQPVYTSAPPPAGSNTPAPTPKENAAQARTQNLLQRNRGIFGTVLTGFRGFLNQSQNNTRKSLLGE
jgi:hypothetical protein